jgi:hypothetical protein
MLDGTWQRQQEAYTQQGGRLMTCEEPDDVKPVERCVREGKPQEVTYRVTLDDV